MSNAKITTATQKSLHLNSEAKLSLSDSNRNPSLPEKMNIVNQWFSSCSDNSRSFKQAEASIDRISELLVTKQLVSDKDTGLKLIMTYLNINEADKEIFISYTHFQRLFCRSLFKESLIEVLHEIEEGVYRKSKVNNQTQQSKSQVLRESQMNGDVYAMASVQEKSI